MKTKQETVIAAINSALAGWEQYFDVAFDSDLVDDEDSYDALFTITPKPFDSDDGRVVGAARTLEFAIIDGEVSLITGEDNEHDVTTANLFAALYFDTLTILDQAAPLAVEPVADEFMRLLQACRELQHVCEESIIEDQISFFAPLEYLSEINTVVDDIDYALSAKPQPAVAVPQGVSVPASLLLNIVDNLNDCPINEPWATRVAAELLALHDATPPEAKGVPAYEAMRKVLTDAVKYLDGSVHNQISSHSNLHNQMRDAITAPPLIDEGSTSDKGQWLPCTPALMLAGVDCANTPRRDGAENHSHDHWIAHTRPQSSEPMGEKAE